VENRCKHEIEDLTRRYEKIKIEKEALEKRLKEVVFHKNLQKKSYEQGCPERGVTPPPQSSEILFFWSIIFEKIVDPPAIFSTSGCPCL
jgi:hypothetical protein